MAEEPKRARKRRGRGEGSIYERADGQWVANVSLGYDANGKRKRATAYGATKKEVQDELRRLQTEFATGSTVEASKLTVGGWLFDWLENTVKVKVRPTTYTRWEALLRLHAHPLIGHVKLSKLDARQVQSLMGTLERRGESAWTRKMVMSVLHNAFKTARRFNYIVRNPCEDLPRAKPAAREMEIPTEIQLKAFCKAAEKKRLAALFHLAAATGMRQGELLGLHWPEVDFERGTVTIRRALAQIKGKFILKEPKSKQSRRTVKLPPFAVAALNGHRQRMLTEGQDVRAGAVFVTRRGTFIGKSNLIRMVFRPVLKTANDATRELAKRTNTQSDLLPPIRFHDLRHTHASLLLRAGESIKAVSLRLGHSSIELTLRVYCHVLPDADNTLAERMEKLFS